MNIPTARLIDCPVPCERRDWRIEDIIGGEKKPDFTMPFLPGGMARTQGLPFLTPREKIILNQIRGFEYVCVLEMLEQHILPNILDHARPHLREDDYRVRILLRGASNDSRRVELFSHFRDAVRDGFDTDCGMFGPADQVAAAILDHGPLAVALLMLHIGWMTQAHYAHSVDDEQKIDAQFSDLFKYHWYDEARRVKAYALLVEALSAHSGRAEIAASADEYLKISVLLDAGLMEQVERNLDSFQAATGRWMTTVELAEYRSSQQQALRWCYLGSGMAHPNFLATVERLDAETRQRIQTVAFAFS